MASSNLPLETSNPAQVSSECLEEMSNGMSSSEPLTVTSDLAQAMSNGLSTSNSPSMTSNLAQVSVEAVTQQVVRDLVSAFCVELASLLPVLLAPIVEELKELKSQSHNKIYTRPASVSFSPDLPPSEQDVRRSRLSGLPAAVDELPSGTGDSEQTAAAVGAAAASTAGGGGGADEVIAANSIVGAGAPAGRRTVEFEDGIATVQQLAAQTIDSPSMRMEIGTMCTPLVDDSEANWEASVCWSWRHLSGKGTPIREGYRLTATDEPGLGRASSADSSWLGRASSADNERVTRLEKRATVHERLLMAQKSIQEGKVEQSWLVKNVTSFLEDPESSTAAMYYSQFMIAFSVLSILVGLLPYMGLDIPLYFEVVIDSILCAEILVRAVFCPNLKEFLSNYANLLDSFSSVPLAVILLMHAGVCDKEMGNGFLLAAVPVIRILRFVRRFPKMQILITAFKDCLEALPVLLYTLAVMGVVFTSAMFLVEPRDNIQTVSESAWLVISTISTVGYGDITPCTKSGAALASVLMVVSQLYMAMPFGIIGYNFTVIWEHRRQIMLMNGTRDRLAKQGFGAYEIPRLFELFDLDGGGEFDMEEFQLLFKEMDIGFKEDDVIELFKLIDKDAGGTIDEREFVKAVYPNEYRFMYGRTRKSDNQDEESNGDPSPFRMSEFGFSQAPSEAPSK